MAQPATTAEGLRIVDHPLVQHKLGLMRDVATPSALFRQLLHEIGQLMAHEATRDLALGRRAVQTPLMAIDAARLQGPGPALVSILRAGNGLLDGVLSVMPMAAVGFVGLYRDEETLRPVQYYCKLPPDLPGRHITVLDPMLATGNSAAAALDLLKAHGARDLRLLCLLAAPEGVARLRAAHPDVAIITAALDKGLNEKGYILPGLGDAGDRMYATK